MILKVFKSVLDALNIENLLFSEKSRLYHFTGLGGNRIFSDLNIVGAMRSMRLWT